MIRKKILSAVLVFAATAGNVGAVELKFSPASASVAPGGSVNVAVSVSGLGSGAAPSLGAYDMSVQYDSSKFSLTGVSFGDPVAGNQLSLESSSFNVADTSTPGTGLLTELSFDSVAALDAAQLDEFVLAMLTFNALSAGTGPLTFGPVVLGDAEGDSLSAILVPGAITVVPVPAAVWLFASALGATAFARRRRHIA